MLETTTTSAKAPPAVAAAGRLSREWIHWVIHLDHDAAARNLEITQSYHDLSSAVADALGRENANWCTLATWGVAHLRDIHSRRGGAARRPPRPRTALPCPRHARAPERRPRAASRRCTVRRRGRARCDQDDDPGRRSTDRGRESRGLLRARAALLGRHRGARLRLVAACARHDRSRSSARLEPEGWSILARERLPHIRRRARRA